MGVERRITGPGQGGEPSLAHNRDRCAYVHSRMLHSCPAIPFSGSKDLFREAIVSKKKWSQKNRHPTCDHFLSKNPFFLSSSANMKWSRKGRLCAGRLCAMWIVNASYFLPCACFLMGRTAFLAPASPYFSLTSKVFASHSRFLPVTRHFLTLHA